MSHLDAESSAVVFAAGVAVSWAIKAAGNNATVAKTRTLLKDFKTREYIRVTSTMKLGPIHTTPVLDTDEHRMFAVARGDGLLRTGPNSLEKKTVCEHYL